MTDKDNDKNQPRQRPVRRVITRDDKPTPPQPVRRVTTGEDKPTPPQPVRRVSTGENKPTPPQPVRRVTTGNDEAGKSQGRLGAARQRIRPSQRAAQHQAKTTNQAMPTPPKRRVLRAGSAVAASAATAAALKAASPEVQEQVEAIQEQYADLEEQAQLGDVYNAIGKIDSKLIELPFELEKLRDRGYVHSGQLEDKLDAIEEKWADDIRPRVEKSLAEQIERLDGELEKASSQLARINPRATATIKAAETAVESLERRVEGAATAVENLYQQLESELNSIAYSFTQVGKMLDLLDGAPTIKRRDAEAPLLAVEAEWHRNGKEGPEGYLFLTDQRLIFEQREEVVTKKRFGLFKAESENLQEVLIDVEVHQIESIDHKEEGGFLGMGKADILELVLDASANVSRARFHLKGQESSHWAAMIKRVQTGDIDKDRSDEYLEELESSGIVSASFPTECPNCYAAIPPQPRGVTSYSCDFCGAVVKPTA